MEPSKNKVFKLRSLPRRATRSGKATRPRQEELAGKANQGAPRNLPQRATRSGKATRPRQEELAGKTDQGTSKPGERQASGPDKITAAARRLPRQAATLRPRSSASTNMSLWGPLRTCVAEGCAASGAQWHAKLTRSPSWRTVAPLTVLFCTVRATQTGPCPLPSGLGRVHCTSNYINYLAFYVFTLLCVATCR